MKKNIFLTFFLFSSILFAAEKNPPSQFDKTLIAQGEIPPDFEAEKNLGPEEEDEVDPRVLRDFIESRGLIECRQKCGKLVIAGDVRARWTATGEKVEDPDPTHHTFIKKRGWKTGIPVNRFRSEINLFLDYETKDSWVSTKLKWSVIDGRDGGSETKSDIDRAFIGYDIYNKDELDFYIEIGRSKLDFIFDSRVEFSSFFDGIHLYYTDVWPNIGTVVIHGGPFVVDSLTNHYAWVAEAFVTKWMGTGFTFKYSIIDWHHNHETAYFGKESKLKGKFFRNNPRYKFIVSQMLFGYERKIDFLGCKTLYTYAAVLANHDPKRTRSTRNKKLNGAWYAGFTLGKLCKAYDWSLDINYQSVQALAVPEFDLSGIGHGNGDGTFIYDAGLLGLSPFLARGFTNYKGWQISLLYAVTDTLSFRSKAEWSTPRNKSVGGDFFYKNFEMSVIYAF